MTDEAEAKRARTIADKYLPRLSDESLDEDEVETALFDAEGNVTRAAEILGVKSMRLRRFIAASARLDEVLSEINEQCVDRAVAIVREGLNDEGSYLVRFYAAKEFLRSEAGRRRGFGLPRNIAVEVEGAAGGKAPIYVLKWLDDDVKAIEGPK
jgi:hypothetical protein